MKNLNRALIALLLVGAMAAASGCATPGTSHRVLNVEDHPNGEVTLLHTLTTEYGVAGYFNTTNYAYWECQRNDAGLDCERVCWSPTSMGEWPKNAPEDGAQCLGYADPADS